MLYFLKNKRECTGCGACYCICPVKCISMQTDEEGFLYPIASDQCIGCGKCEKVCPQNTVIASKNKFEKTAISSVSRSRDIWQRSSSGGAFSEICNIWGDNDTLIVGAAWIGLHVEHICVKGVENITPLCKSKYIASFTNDIFIQVKEGLSSGKKVIFSGTPCQVAGLNSYLGKKYDNLLTIDLICHGVGSPAVFSACINFLEQQFGKKIQHYEFRAKRLVYDVDHLTKLVFTDNTEKYLSDDPYIQLFLSQRALRPSCASPCVFRNENRPGDITIADCKGLFEMYPWLKGTKHNYSTVVANTFKGESVVNRLGERMEILPCEISNVKKYNPLFYRQTYFPRDREDFFGDFARNQILAISKWTEPYKESTQTWKRKLYDQAPQFVRKWVSFVLNMRENNEQRQ